MDHSLKEKKLKKKSFMYVPIIENVTRIMEDKTSFTEVTENFKINYLQFIISRFNRPTVAMMAIKETYAMEIF